MTATDPCPPEQQLAAFVDGRLAGSEREAVEQHLDRCSRCFELVASLGQVAESPVPVVSDRLRDAVIAQRPGAPWRRAAASLSAAAVVVLAAWWTMAPPAPERHPAAAAAREAHATVRSGSESDLVVLERPRDGETVAAGTELQWRGPADATSYEVQISTPEGDVLWRGTVGGRRRALRLEAALPPSQQCHVWIAAYLPDGRRVTSDVVTIQTPPER